MKISKLFHWLYASLMLLPFASVVSTTLYYSFNKNAVIPQVEKEVSKEVDFNQLYNPADTINNQVSNGVTLSISNNVLSFNGTQDGAPVLFSILTGDKGINLTGNNHKIYLKGLGSVSTSWALQTKASPVYTDSYGDLFYTDLIFTYPYDFLRLNFRYNSSSSDTYNFTKQFMIFDLTQMFGIGNEPSMEDFNSWFTDEYYTYTLSERIVIPNYETIQVADNSINHFWLPSFGAIGYNIQSYIGWLIGSVFGLNVVNGIGFVIVRLFTYWLIISICWLIFDLLMYVPNLVHKWLDKAAID